VSGLVFKMIRFEDEEICCFLARLSANESCGEMANLRKGKLPCKLGYRILQWHIDLKRWPSTAPAVLQGYC
jgi:hypothetical protein